MYVIKASGDREKFNLEKIRKTCLKAGASKDLAEEVVKKVDAKVYNGITTKEILELTLKFLQKEPTVAVRYNLKRAIMQLGPSGFPFEKFVAEILQNYGYRTKIGQIIKGKCVEHEIDIQAIKDKRYMVECKYHNAPGTHTSLKVALYTYARFLDLSDRFDQAWLICNTRCTSEVIKYAECVDLELLSWGYPTDKSLERLIERKKLYPVTILTTVNRNVKDRFAGAQLMLVKNLLEHEVQDLKRKTGLSENILNKIREEGNKICFC